MGHGGARPGAGAKPKAIVQAKQNFASLMLPDERERELWEEMLTASRVTSVILVGDEDGAKENITEPDYKIRLDALKYLSDHKYGKAPQSVKLGGDEENDSPVKVLLIGAKS